MLQCKNKRQQNADLHAYPRLSPSHDAHEERRDDKMM